MKPTQRLLHNHTLVYIFFIFCNERGETNPVQARWANVTCHLLHSIPSVMTNLCIFVDRFQQYVNTQMMVVQTETKVLRTSRRSDAAVSSDKVRSSRHHHLEFFSSSLMVPGLGRHHLISSTLSICCNLLPFSPSVAISCHSLHLLQSPAILSCCNLLSFSPVAISCHSLLLQSPAILSCCNLLPFSPVAISCHSLLLQSPAILSCCNLLPFSPVAISCHSLLLQSPAILLAVHLSFPPKS